MVEARGQSGGLWMPKQNDYKVVTSMLDVYRDTITLKVVSGT